MCAPSVLVLRRRYTNIKINMFLNRFHTGRGPSYLLVPNQNQTIFQIVCKIFARHRRSYNPIKMHFSTELTTDKKREIMAGFKDVWCISVTRTFTNKAQWGWLAAPLITLLSNGGNSLKWNNSCVQQNVEDHLIYPTLLLELVFNQLLLSSWRSFKNFSADILKE